MIEVARGLKILKQNETGWDPGLFFLSSSDSRPNSTYADRYLSIRGYPLLVYMLSPSHPYQTLPDPTTGDT